jgi:hypothetical protein
VPKPARDCESDCGAPHRCLSLRGIQDPRLAGRYAAADDPNWKDLCWLYEYFHADTGQGLGAAHQTGWSGLLANLVMRRYQKDIRPWSGIDSGERPTLIDEIA